MPAAFENRPATKPGIAGLRMETTGWFPQIGETQPCLKLLLAVTWP
jgi:hypothetical protein